MQIFSQLSLFEKLIDFLSYELPKTPTMYGWFHLLFLGILVVFIVLMIKQFKHSTKREMDLFLRTVGGILLVLEIYKQLVFTLEGNIWDYQWYAFPFQFCSVPMYIMFIVSFLNEGKVKRAMYAFLATYSLFAGFAVMFYPVDVFISTLGISIQTMVHHGAMALVGIVLLATGHVVLERKEVLRASSIFFMLGLVAFVLNVLLYPIGETFNMFFIGPFYPTHLPILTLIEAEFGYIPFLVSYFLGFSLLAYLMMLGAIFIENVKISLETKKSIFTHRRSA